MGNFKKQTYDQSKFKSIFPNIKENIKFIQDEFNETADLQTREIKWNEKKGIIIYLETIVDSDQLQNGFLIPLAQAENNKELEKLITTPEFNKKTDLFQIIFEIVNGHCALFIEGYSSCILFDSMKINPRSPDEPDAEKTVRGAHNGFIENIGVNLNLVRDNLRNRNLTIKYLILGAESHTKVAIIYMNNIANKQTVQEVEKRLRDISADMIYSPGYIQETLEDSPFSPFPQMVFTERPDRVTANLTEGRIVVMADGSSDALIVPITVFSLFQSPDDYNLRFMAGSYFRLLRFLSFWVCITLPAMYIAIVGFHFEIIPYDMVRIVKGSIENIPFSPLLEALIMAVTIELIREAGIRLPSPIGQTIGIVGGLIIGDAVVNAGFISNTMVIIIALTAIMSFVIPSYGVSNTARIISFPIMLSAAALGFVGIVFSLMILLIHLCKLESFGTPYFSSIAPLHVKDLKDTFIRIPIWLMKERPKGIKAQKPIKQKTSRDWSKYEE